MMDLIDEAPVSALCILRTSDGATHYAVRTSYGLIVLDHAAPRDLANFRADITALQRACA